MENLISLEEQIRERLAAAQARRRQGQEMLSREMVERQGRCERFEVVAARLLDDIICPRLTMLSGLFPSARLTLPDDTTKHRCECSFDHVPEFPANAKLEISVFADDAVEAVECAVLHYSLEILPVFFQFDRSDELIVPLNAVNEQSVSGWLDSKLLAFTDTYLQLQSIEQYQQENMVTDPVCGMTVDEAAAFHAERDGKTFYFCSERCRDKFLPAPAGANPAEKSSGCCG